MELKSGVKPKLLVITSTFPRWHNDTDPPFVYELSRRLVDTFEVTVHAPHYPGAKTREIMDGMHIHRFRYFFAPLEKLAASSGILPTLRHNKLYYGLVPFFLLAQFVSLLLLIRKNRPDLIHAHWIIPQGFIAALVRSIRDVPVIATAHGADIFGLQHAVFTAIKRFAIKKMDAITVVSKPLARALTDIAGSDLPVQVIPMGVDSSLFSPDKQNVLLRNTHAANGPLLLFVGRLTEKKGVDYLIDAMPSVLTEIPTAVLLIVGSGELAQRLQDQVTKLGLDEHIRFTGSVPNSQLPGYFASADIFIGPSIKAAGGDTEGFGLTFVEAIMSGCLVIGTATGGIGDIIEDDETGLLVPEKDPEALADKILYALGNEQEMQRLKENARNRCLQKYDWNVISEQYAAVFCRILHRKGKREGAPITNS